jgi:hypothetical protein
MDGHAKTHEVDEGFWSERYQLEAPLEKNLPGKRIVLATEEL